MVFFVFVVCIFVYVVLLCLYDCDVRNDIMGYIVLVCIVDDVFIIVYGVFCFSWIEGI